MVQMKRGLVRRLLGSALSVAAIAAVAPIWGCSSAPAATAEARTAKARSALDYYEVSCGSLFTWDQMPFPEAVSPHDYDEPYADDPPQDDVTDDELNDQFPDLVPSPGESCHYWHTYQAVTCAADGSELLDLDGQTVRYDYWWSKDGYPSIGDLPPDVAVVNPNQTCPCDSGSGTAAFAALGDDPPPRPSRGPLQTRAPASARTRVNNGVIEVPGDLGAPPSVSQRPAGRSQRRSGPSDLSAGPPSGTDEVPFRRPPVKPRSQYTPVVELTATTGLIRQNGFRVSDTLINAIENGTLPDNTLHWILFSPEKLNHANARIVVATLQQSGKRALSIGMFPEFDVVATEAAYDRGGVLTKDGRYLLTTAQGSTNLARLPVELGVGGSGANLGDALWGDLSFGYTKTILNLQDRYQNTKGLKQVVHVCSAGAAADRIMAIHELPNVQQAWTNGGNGNKVEVRVYSNPDNVTYSVWPGGGPILNPPRQ